MIVCCAYLYVCMCVCGYVCENICLFKMACSYDCVCVYLHLIRVHFNQPWHFELLAGALIGDDVTFLHGSLVDT